jgi:hypothetical protein
MTWRVQSKMEGPLNLADIGLTFTKGQIRDLDVIGRENAEKSNDIKMAMMKGWIIQLSKDAGPPKTIDQGVVEGLHQAAVKAGEVATQASQAVATQNEMIARLEATIKMQAEQLAKYQEESRKKQKQQDQLMDKTDKILTEVREFAARDPLRLQDIKTALLGIQAERGEISKQLEQVSKSETSDAEVHAHQKILEIKEKKLAKNFEDLGRTISQEADNVQDALDAMDQLGL